MRNSGDELAASRRERTLREAADREWSAEILFGIEWTRVRSDLMISHKPPRAPFRLFPLALLGRSLTVTEYHILTLLHEFKHVVGDGTESFNRVIDRKCRKGFF